MPDADAIFTAEMKVSQPDHDWTNITVDCCVHALELILKYTGKDCEGKSILLFINDNENLFDTVT